MAEGTSTRGAAGWAVRTLAVVLILIGLVLAAGGGWLAVLGGSWYYLLAGIGLVVSGLLLFRGRAEGVWLYWLVFLATLVWALWEAGGDGWALVPRVFAPAVLLVLVSLAAMVFMRRGRALALTAAAVAIPAAVFAFAGLTGYENEVPARGGNRAALAPAAAPSLPGSGVPPVGADWPAYAGGYDAKHYSPLTQITKANVGELVEVWRYRTRDMPSEAAQNKYSPENTPLKIGDHLYICSAKNILIALHAATGKERWRYDPQVPDDAIPYGATCRGVAYYAAPNLDPREPCAERIVQGTLDARLIAVDARTGQPCAGFGVNGAVNLRVGLGDNAPGFYAVTSPPTVVRGVLVMGAQVKDGQRRDAPSGVIRGYDALTGELRWAWDMEQPELTGAPPPGQTYSRGTPNMWTIASADEALGHVYLPMGNASVDYWGATRSPPENFYATSLVALDATTGRPVWRFQTVRYDVWDYDLGSQATLFDLPTRQGVVPALVLPSKQGDLYILDRRTGRPLHGVENRPAPIGGVEPQNLSRTQPFSLFHTLAKRDLTERSMWGMSPIDQLWCRIQFRRSAYDGIYTPPTADRRWIQYPGYNGGSDWGGVAVDPRRGVIVANYNDMPNFNRLIPREEARPKSSNPIDVPDPGAVGPDQSRVGPDPQWGAPYAIDVNAGWRVKFTGLLCKEPPYGGIRAIDLATGRTLWDKPIGTARRNGPFGLPTFLPWTIGTPNNGGPLVTASGLVFVAASTDNLFRAYDLSTGEKVWEGVLPAGGQATPMTYAVDGRQYVVIAPGGHHFMETPVGDHVIAYALPQTEAPGVPDLLP